MIIEYEKKVRKSGSQNPKPKIQTHFPTHSENRATGGKVPQGGPKAGPSDAQSFSPSTWQFGGFCESLYLELYANSSLQCVELHKYLMALSQVVMIRAIISVLAQMFPQVPQ